MFNTSDQPILNQKPEPPAVSNVVQPWRWRYGFSRYTTGRAWRLAGSARLQVEGRDRTVARTGPNSGLHY